MAVDLRSNVSREAYRSPERGAFIGPYCLLQRIGVGGMAEVYEAARTGPHGFVKRVALKRILPHIVQDPAFVAMFIHEATVAAQLAHPNVVQVFDFGDDQGELYLTMELVRGTTVGRLLRALAMRGEAVPLDVALHLCTSAARALAHAHRLCDEQGRPLQLVHRDVSPGNLLLSCSGHLKLTDFGIVHTHSAERHTLTDHLRGKVGYMSPEQVRGELLSARSDVFTLVVIFAEMLLGERLFAQGNDLDVLLRIRDVDLSVLQRTGRRIPSDVRRVLLAGLAQEPQARPSADGLCTMFEDLMACRGAVGDGSQTTSALLKRLGLVEETTCVSPTERCLWAGERLGGAASAGHLSGGPDAPVGWTAGQFYSIDGAAGTVTFPELARLCSTGQVQASTPIRRGREAPCPARALQELARFFATPALQWCPQEVKRPWLRGELGAAILLPLVHSLAVRRANGMLFLESGDRRKKIYFVNGRPDFVASNDRSEMLGDYLVGHAHCAPRDLDLALAMLPRFGGRLGDALLRLGILRPVELYRAVTGQVRSRYLEAFGWRTGQWRYVRDATSCEETYAIEQDGHLLMRDAAATLDATQLEAALAPLRARVFRPATSPPAALSAYQLPENWQWVLEQVDGVQSLGALLERCQGELGAAGEEVLRAVFFAVSCQLFEAA